MRKASILTLACLLILVPVPLGVLYVQLRAEVEQRFAGTLFSVPSRVYSRPLTLAPDLDIEGLRLLERLGALGYRPAQGGEVRSGEYARTQELLAIGRHEEQGVETRRIVLRLSPQQVIRQIEQDGRPVDSAELEGEQIGEIHGPIRISRRLRTLDELPPQLIAAVLAIEDRQYYTHGGLDLTRIVGALLANLRAGRIVQGGSTITQQLAKNFFLEPDRTLSRKLHEAGLAFVMERLHSKDELLQAYLNEIYLGQRGSVAVHGVGEGAWHYFGKMPDQLTLAESAMLAGVIAAPGRYSPFQDLDAALARRNLVLGLLHSNGSIDDVEYAMALAETPTLSHSLRESALAPYFLDYLRRQLPASVAARSLETVGITIHSTIDPQLQRFAARAVSEGVERLEREIPSLVRKDAPLQAALVALDPRSGELLALVGGRSYGRSQFDHASQAQRQAGSIFKPIVALAALSDVRHEPRYTLASKLLDEPFEFDAGEEMWSPTNFDDEFRGPVTLREAIEHSINVPIARLGLEIGPARVVAAARRLGIRSPLHAVASISLGSNDVTLLEMTRAYGVLATGGVLHELRSYREVVDAQGALLDRLESQETRVFDEGPVFLVTSALMGAVEHGTGARLRSLGLNGPLAGKTGTTNDFRDAWFIGYTPDLVAGVWVGYDDGASIHLPGSRAALPIFAAFMKPALGTLPVHDFATPEGITVAHFERLSRTEAGPLCEDTEEVFIVGTVPETSCLPEVAAQPPAAEGVDPAAELATRSVRWLLEQLGVDPEARD